MMNEWATYDDIMTAFTKAHDYGFISARNTAVRRKLKRQHDVLHRVNTMIDKIPVIYWFQPDPPHITILPLAGKQGESYAVRTVDKNRLIVLHAHAIDRFKERTAYTGTDDDALRSIIINLMFSAPVSDSDTSYIGYHGGLFLCNMANGVLHARTFITYEQCHTNQKLWLSKSENERVKLLEDIANQLKQEINGLSK